MGKVAASALRMYKIIDAGWKEAKLPTPLAIEAEIGARKIWKECVGTWRFSHDVNIASGNRFTWVRVGDRLTINPDRNGEGWSALVHDLSHLAHYYNGKGARPHCHQHALLERTMQRYLISLVK